MSPPSFPVHSAGRASAPCLNCLAERSSLGFLDRRDLPFHYALAEAYTIGDAYHCSAISATGPNRTYLRSGTINADQRHGGYVACSGGDELGQFLPWKSYAETLQESGVSWRVYQCADDYGDNGVEYFDTFAKLDPAQGGRPRPATRSTRYDQTVVGPNRFLRHFVGDTASAGRQSSYHDG